MLIGACNPTLQPTPVLQELPPYSNAWCDVDEHCPDAKKYCKAVFWDCHHSAECTMCAGHLLVSYGVGLHCVQSEPYWRIR